MRAAAVRRRMADARTRHQAWIREHGTGLPGAVDWTLPEAAGWTWNA